MLLYQVKHIRIGKSKCKEAETYRDLVLTETVIHEVHHILQLVVNLLKVYFKYISQLFKKALSLTLVEFSLDLITWGGWLTVAILTGLA